MHAPVWHGRNTVVAVLIAVLTAAASAQDEPRVRGRTLSAWITQLRDSDFRNRRAAAEAIGTLGTKAKAAVEPLVTVLFSEDFEAVRVAAVNTLGQIGRDAKPAVLRLTMAVGFGSGTGDKEWTVRAAAATALTRIAPDDDGAFKSIFQALQDPDARVRSAAADALVAVGPSVKKPLRDSLGLGSGRELYKTVDDIIIRIDAAESVKKFLKKKS
jgi:HEAT repeat protein